MKGSSFLPPKGAESHPKGGIPLERFVRAACGARKRRVKHNSAFAPPSFLPFPSSTLEILYHCKYMRMSAAAGGANDANQWAH